MIYFDEALDALKAKRITFSELTQIALAQHLARLLNEAEPDIKRIKATRSAIARFERRTGHPALTSLAVQ
jgi:hypothetical protein